MFHIVRIFDFYLRCLYCYQLQIPIKFIVMSTTPQVQIDCAHDASTKAYRYARIMCIKQNNYCQDSLYEKEDLGNKK